MSEMRPRAPASIPGVREPAPPAVADHELLRRIGRGSYGEVWLARSLTGAYRAVKIVYRQSFDHDRPFEREFSGILKFEPLSRQHKSQVDILHVGRAPGCFYYVMELADDQFTGQQIAPDSYAPRTLQSELLQRGKLTFEDCVQISLALTTALDHLHTHGLVHRDVKPSNIIFVNGVPKLADIGLVTGVDATRSFVGTEGFTPPEGPGTPQADIYSLGKVLYEICTGKDRHEFPELPTDLRELPERDAIMELNAVIAKACRADVRERYASARAMHNDLAILQSGKSLARVRALELTLGRVKRWSAAVGAISALLVAAYAYQAHQTRTVGRLALENLRLARENSDGLLQLQVANAVPLMDKGDLTQSLLWLAEAFRQVTNNPELERVHRVRLQSVIEHCPNLVQVLRYDAPVTRAAFSQDGTRLLSLSPNAVRVTDLSSGKEIFAARSTNRLSWASFSDDVRSVQVLEDTPRPERTASPRSAAPWPGVDQRMRLFDLNSGEDVLEPRIRNVSALSLDGRLALEQTGTNRWILKECASGRPLTQEVETLGLWLDNARFSENGRILAISSPARSTLGIQFEFWDVPARQRVGNTVVITNLVFGNFLLSPTGSRLLTVESGANGRVKLWSVPDARFVGDLVGIPVFSRDGQWLVSDHNQTVRIWNAETGAPAGAPFKHRGVGARFDFGPDSLMLALADQDGVTEVWDPFEGQVLFPPIRSGARVRDLVFSPEGKRLAVAGADGLVRVWELPLRTIAERQVHLPDVGRHVAFSSDGAKIITSSSEARAWNARAEGVLSSAFDPVYPIGRTALSEGGHLAVSYAGADLVNCGLAFRGAYLWEPASARIVCSPLITTGAVLHAEFSPDASHLLTVTPRFAEIWSIPAGQRTGIALTNGSLWVGATFTSEGERIVAVSRNGKGGVWDGKGGGELHELFDCGTPIQNAVFSSDKRWVATLSSGDDGTVRIWNIAGGAGAGRSFSHGGNVQQAAFSPSSERLITWGSAPEVKLWELTQDDPLRGVLRLGDQAITCACFSPDERSILATSLDGTARVWSTLDAQPLTVLLKHGRGIRSAQFSPADPGFCVTAGDDAFANFWRLSACQLPAYDVTDLAQLLCGHRLDNWGTLRALPAGEVLLLFESFCRRHPSYRESSSEELWQRAMGEYALEHEHATAAAWHAARALEMHPDDVLSLKLLARSYGELGNWSAARHGLERLCQSAAGQVEDWENLGLACLADDDMAGYTKVCADAVARFRSDLDPLVLRQLSALLRWEQWTFDASEDLLDRLRQALADRGDNPIYRREYAIALCRSGHWLDGATELEQYRRMGPGPHTDYLGEAFLAIADVQIGKAQEAVGLWQDLRPRMEGWLRRSRREEGPDWAARIAIERLRKEYERAPSRQ